MARYRVGLETRQRILAATREMLGEEGLLSTTLKAITDRAGVGAGSFYNLFDSKEAAVWEVLSQAIEAVDPHPDEAGSETVDELVAAFVAFTIGDADLARIFLQLAAAALTDEFVADRIARSHLRRVQRFTAAIRRQSPQLTTAEATMHAEVMLASLAGLAVRLGLDPDFDFAAHVARLPRLPTAR